MNLDEDQYAAIIAGIRVLETQHRDIMKRLDLQDELLDNLKAKAEQGKGALWVLMGIVSTLGALAGAFMTNAKALIHYIAR